MSDLDLKKGFDFAILRRLLATMKPYRSTVILSLLSLAVATGAELMVPVLLQNGIDQGVLRRDVGHLTLVALGILAMLGLTLLTSFYQIYALSRLSQNVMIDLRTGLLAHFQRQSSRWLYNHPVGKLVAGVTSDVATLSDFFNTLFTSLLKDFVTMLGVIAVLFCLNAQLAFWTVLSLPLVLVLVVFFRTWSRRAYRRVRAQVSRVTAFLSEHLQGMSIVQLFGREQASRETFAQENAALLAANLAELTVNAVFRPLIDVLWAITLGFLIWFGTGLYQHGAVSLGVLIAFINLVGRFYQPVGSLAENFTQLQSAMAGAERVFHYTDEQTALADSGVLTTPPRDNSLRFEQVHFRYLADEPVLQGLDFSVQAGQTIALVGTTGAGKTTITSLLTRLWDVDQGRILWGGHDIRDYRLDVLRGSIQSVLQDVFLFSDTVANNIDLGRGLSRERLREVCRLVQADAWIEQLPQGYDTMLNEGATNISAGQRQLLSFARVLAQDPQVLILDEATANIDTETEVLIQKALEALLKGRTSLVIAHRLSTIRRADQILALDEGRILEAGTHQQLLDRQGFYANLYKLQYAQAGASQA